MMCWLIFTDSHLALKKAMLFFKKMIWAIILYYFRKRKYHEDNQGLVLLSTLQEGEGFGEMALISGSKRTATAITKTDCQLLYLLTDDFQKLIQDHKYFI